ncbi:MAG: hypothetical protein ACR2GU_04750 [Rubrobacteraceae bacterium]
MEEPNNPYTILEGYKLYDASREEVGEIEGTVYDEPSDILKYILVDGRVVPADGMEVDAEENHVFVPYDRKAIESAPKMEDYSGEFDERLREHYEI